jgi:hypothetical protein
MRIFVTHIVPKKNIMEYGLSMAACNFSWNLINGGAFDKVYSVLPTFVNRRVEPFDGLVYSRFRRCPLLRRLAPIAENLCLFFHIHRGDSVWYYNCNILNAVLIVLLKVFKPHVKQQMIILDYTQSKKIWNRFFLWQSNHLHGTIRLADSSLFTVKNSVCLPGVVPENVPDYPQIVEIKKDFLISGVLGDNIAMLPMLLKTFAQMPELTLHITGKAPDPELIKKYTGRYKNIIYHGMVEYEEYLRILHATPFLLSTRNPACPENQCNFPSKIIEALLHNRIVISTIHYDQLNGIKYLEMKADEIGFINSMQSILSMDQGLLIEYANQESKVRMMFGCEIWKNRMRIIENNELI